MKKVKDLPKKTEYLLIGGFAVGYHGYPRAMGRFRILKFSCTRREKGLDIIKLIH